MSQEEQMDANQKLIVSALGAFSDQLAEMNQTLREAPEKQATALKGAVISLIKDPEIKKAAISVFGDADFVRAVLHNIGTVMADDADRKAGGWLRRHLVETVGGLGFKLILLALAIKFVGLDMLAAAVAKLKS